MALSYHGTGGSSRTDCCSVVTIQRSESTRQLSSSDKTEGSSNGRVRPHGMGVKKYSPAFWKSSRVLSVYFIYSTVQYTCRTDLNFFWLFVRLALNKDGAFEDDCNRCIGLSFK